MAGVCESGRAKSIGSGGGIRHRGLSARALLAMVAAMSVADTIRAKLTAALAPDQIDLVDDSDRHRGHGGWKEGGETHFNLTVVAQRFAGMGRVDRQRLVYQLLADELAGPVHALQLTTLAPGEQPRR